jgi:PAS domain S-box-containing protein
MLHLVETDRDSAPRLQSVLSTAELRRRPSRPPDYAAENRALMALASEMAASPDGILQKLADTALVMCRAHSAGLSLLEEGDQKRNFHWRAIAGNWAHHRGGGTPRDFGPCGTVLDRNVALLFSHPERDFPYFGEVMPLLDEGLLIPFYIKGEAVGTIWVVGHDESCRFDAEDLRVMTNLGTFAAAAYQNLLSLNATRRMASIVESSDDAIVSKNLNGVITTWNRGAERLFGYTAEEAIGRPITILIPPDRLHEEAMILGRIGRGERVERYETVRRRKDGSLAEVSVTVSPLFGDDGRGIGASKIARDITDRKRAQEQKDLLLREMSHRVRNLFTLADGLVALSARSARTPEDLAQAAGERLRALSRAHELTLPDLGRGRERVDRSTTLHALLHAIFVPYEDPRDEHDRRLVAGGPDVSIQGNAVTSLALLLHEFAANAAKYGALSSASGGVAVDWSVADGELHLTWKEHGGPSLSGQPGAEGFGSFLARATVTNQLGGQISHDWRPEGLIINLSARLERLTG